MSEHESERQPVASSGLGLLVTGVWLVCLYWIFLLGAVRLSASPVDNWHWRNPQPQGNRLNDVTFANGTFVAAGERGAVVTSKSGTNWTARPMVSTNSMTSVAYGAGVFVAVGSAG